MSRLRPCTTREFIDQEGIGTLVLVVVMMGTLFWQAGAMLAGLWRIGGWVAVMPMAAWIGFKWGLPVVVELRDEYRRTHATDGGSGDGAK